MNRVATITLSLAMIVGCSSPSGTGGDSRAAQNSGKADGQAQVDDTEPPPAPPAAPVRVTVSSPAEFTDDFSGHAMAFMRQSAIQAPPDLLADVIEHVRTARGLGDCRPNPINNQAYLADIDGDGTWEGLALYTLDNCGAPDNVVRSFMVLRRQADMSWRPVLDVATSVKRNALRPITSIGGGKITLAPEPDGFGEMGEAEVLAVPETVDQNG